MLPWAPTNTDRHAFEADRNGIFCSRKPGPRYEEIPAGSMALILDDVPLHGARAALDRHLTAEDIISADYLFTPARARFLERVPDPGTPDSRALEIGSGYGPIVRALARRYAEVVAVESSYERLRFSQLWHREEGISNVRYVRAGAGEVSLGDAQFDLVVLNGSLEWLPYEHPDQPPRTTQLNILKRIRSALRPNGLVYIGIENRFALYALAGYPEPHTGIRFHSVLPRAAADLLSRLFDRRRSAAVPNVEQLGKYLNHTYSYGGYRRLLRDAGFSAVDFAVPWPSYNRPDVLLSDAPGQIAAYSRHPLYRVAVGLGRIIPAALWHLAPSYAIYARR